MNATSNAPSKRLEELHGNIARVRRSRTLVRLGYAIAICLGLLLLGVVAAFGLDVLARMGRVERFIILLLLAALLIWSVRRFFLPAWRERESMLETAMRVEQGQSLNSGLVAAMQFEDTGREQHGSAELREATVRHTAEMSPYVRFRSAVAGQKLNRIWPIGIGLLTALLLFAFAGDYSKAFFNRLFLGKAHYPSDTQIENVAAPGERTPFGRAVPFVVQAGGVLPKDGRVEIRGENSHIRTAIDLRPSPDDPSVFTGQLERAVEPFRYQVYLGDAYTDPTTVTITPLPDVRVDFTGLPPEYAAARFEQQAARRRSRTYLQGSKVEPLVTCSNKTLVAATLRLRRGLEESAMPLVERDGAFVLEATNTMFEALDATVQWSVEVEDEDGLSPERPNSGVLQVVPDQAPQVALASSSRIVWPGARPVLRYKAVDDFALEAVTAHLSVLKLGATNLVESAIDVVKPEQNERILSGSLPLDLEPLALEKGDRLLVQFEAVDFRGGLPARSRRSDTLTLEVTDRDSVLLALREEVETQSEEKLEQIINAQLGIGSL